MNQFPMIITLAPIYLSELIECEYGSFEDAGANALSVDEGTGTTHVVNILQRQKRNILIKDESEARTVYLAVCSGTFQLFHLRIAERICDRLRQFCTPDDLQLWPRPMGV